MRLFCLALLCLCQSAVQGAVLPMDAPSRTVSASLYSEVLQEHREFRVQLPVDYFSAEDKRYPVFYVSDADWNFELVAATLDYLSYWGRIPAFIVAGAVNVSRNRDFLPRTDANFPSSGEGDSYLRHLREEWLPWVDGQYRTTDRRVLFGHSFGGVLTLNQLFTDATLFDAYIALGSSVWVADRVLLERAEAFLGRGLEDDTFLYLAVGEGDGGATVPDGQRLADLLHERAPAGLDWSHQVMPGENHFSNVTVALHHALDALFPFWGFDQTLLDAAGEGGESAVEAWFDQQRGELGWRFHPQSMELSLAAYRLADAGAVDAAMAVFDALQTRYPENASVLQTRTQAEARLGQIEAAMASLGRAESLARRVGWHADRVQRLLDLRQRIADSADR